MQTLIRCCAVIRLGAQAFPSTFVIRFGSCMGGLVGLFCRRDQRISIAHLNLAFPRGLDGNEDASRLCNTENPIPQHRMSEIAGAAFRHMGESVAEIILWERFFDSKAQTQGKISRCGEDVFAELRKSKIGALGLSAHFGSFELLAAYLAHQGIPCSVIGRSPNYPALGNAVREFRKSFGVEVIWSDTPEAPRQIIRALRGGRVICVLLDQDTKWKSEYSPFFGIDAASPSGAISLALRYDIPIFTSFIRRIGKMNHEVTTELVKPPRDELNSCKAVLDVFNQRLEEMIQKSPEQYLWWHRRWRRRPGIDYQQQPQLLRSTEQYLEWVNTLTKEKRLLSLTSHQSKRGCEL